ncbi:MAG: hypothetical protein WCF57_17245, partial [Pyrinomonadaceae bacterium]
VSNPPATAGGTDFFHLLYIVYGRSESVRYSGKAAKLLTVKAGRDSTGVRGIDLALSLQRRVSSLLPMRAHVKLA